MIKGPILALVLVLSIVIGGSLSARFQDRSEAKDMYATIPIAVEEFLTKVSDKGALSNNDYQTLSSTLQTLGGKFRITLTISRLVDVPDASLGSVKDHVIVYVFDSQSNANDFPVDTLYLHKSEFLDMRVEQILPTPWQISEQNRSGREIILYSENYGKGVSADGNALMQGGGY